MNSRFEEGDKVVLVKKGFNDKFKEGTLLSIKDFKLAGVYTVRVTLPDMTDYDWVSEDQLELVEIYNSPLYEALYES